VRRSKRQFGVAFFLIAPIKRIDWTQIGAPFNFYSESRWSIGRVEMTLPPGLHGAVRCGTLFLLFLPLKPLSGAPLRGLIFCIENESEKCVEPADTPAAGSFCQKSSMRKGIFTFAGGLNDRF
jgi:hypothetical protein